MVRGKFTVTKIAQVSWSKDARIVTLNAEYDSTIEEDKKYAKATPSAQIEMTIDNPPASDYLAMGKKFYVDFTAVE